ncbi:hypothetical protein KC963_02500 [Candidatus Saccharibacteria bacterium]|nr:hypothetical protein [Candidatus Saccharibacteria bacterium]
MSQGITINGKTANGQNIAVQVDENGVVSVSGILTVTGLVPGVDYDYLDVQQTDSDTETYVYKTGGSGGTTVRTIVVNYTDSTKKNIDNVAWS